MHLPLFLFQMTKRGQVPRWNERRAHRNAGYMEDQTASFITYGVLPEHAEAQQRGPCDS
jgi:hypothetical protein